MLEKIFHYLQEVIRKIERTFSGKLERKEEGKFVVKSESFFPGKLCWDVSRRQLNRETMLEICCFVRFPGRRNKYDSVVGDFKFFD